MMLFRWPSALLVCVAGAVAVWFLGYRAAAGGIGMGYALFLVNGVLLYESGRSLLVGGRRKSVRLVAALASAGRLLFLGLALSAIGLFLSRETVLGAGGGLLISQLNLRFPLRGTKEAG